MMDSRNKRRRLARHVFGPSRGLGLISLLLSAAILATLLARPELRIDGAPWPDRIALAFVVVGIIGGFIHGSGSTVTRRLARIAADPRFAWPAMILGLAWLVWRNH
jgi:hypothetical protein